MELNALTRWDSVGKDLVNLDKIQAELETLQKKGVIQENDWKELRKVLSQPDFANILSKRPSVLIREKEKPRKNKWVYFIVWGARRFAKGFAIGFGVHLVLSLLRTLFRTANPFTLLRALRGLVTAPEPWRYGTFLGSFFCVFESVMRISRFYTHSRSEAATYRAVIGGALAGLTFGFVPKGSRLGICLFFLVRAMELFCRVLVEKQLLPSFDNADTFVMAVASAQVVWATLAGSETLDSTYRRFMDVHTGKPVFVKAALRSVCTGEPLTEDMLTKVNEWRHSVHWPLIQMPVADTNLQQYTCDLIHHGQSCSRHFVSFFLQALRRTVPVYLPVYFIPLFLFRLKKVFSDPVRTLGHAVLGMGQSAIFLATYCASAWYGLCWARTCYWQPGTAGHVQALVAGFVGGHAVLIEKKSRRIELALYVLSHALQSFARAFPAYMPNIPNYEIILFSVSAATIMYAYICRPKLLRPSYFTLVRFMFGSGGRREGFPKAIPPSPAHGAAGLSESKRFQSTPNMGATMRSHPPRSRAPTTTVVPPLRIGKAVNARNGADEDTDGSNSEQET